MRTLLAVLAGVALLSGVITQPANAGKGTDFDRFVKRIQKFAVADIFTQKPRSLCVCQDGGLNHTRVGTLRHWGQLGDRDVSVVCWVHKFDPDGVFEVAHECNTFEVLSK